MKEQIEKQLELYREELKKAVDMEKKAYETKLRLHGAILSCEEMLSKTEPEKKLKEVK